MKTLTALAALAALAAASMLLGPTAFASRDAEKAAQRAVTAYLAGRYQEALPDLELAQQGGAATGPHLYMLAYCYDTVKQDTTKSKETYAAAKTQLEIEIAGKKPALESYFYLTNLHQNQGNTSKAREIALSAVEAIKNKKIKVGSDGTSQFRSGKLTTDSGDQTGALDYFRRAVAAFLAMKDPPPAYLERTLEPVAVADLGRGDPAAVSDMWEKLVAISPNVTDGHWKLGLAALRAGRYAIARDAFKKAEHDAGDRGQEAYYADRLSDGAAGLVTAGLAIPAKDPDGKTITELTSEALDTQLKGYSQKAGAILARPLQPDEYQVLPPPGPKGRPRLMAGPKLMAEISESQRQFVALAIERFLRNRAIQEDAFTGGYAPLIMQDWVGLWRENHRAISDEAAAKAKAASSQPSASK